MSTEIDTREKRLSTRIAERFGVQPKMLMETLKKTAFRGDVSTEQMVALLIVADQYKLNPFTKELYAFPDKHNGIVPVVGVDGWSRIINEHPQFDGMNFDQDEEACTCTIFRKDRNHPIAVTEYMDECRLDKGPWKSHPKRMLRHKAMIQCARIAFGFAGIHDPDEAERIVETSHIDSESVSEPEPEPDIRNLVLEAAQQIGPEEVKVARYRIQTTKTKEALRLYHDQLLKKIEAQQADTVDADFTEEDSPEPEDIF